MKTVVELLWFILALVALSLTIIYCANEQQTVFATVPDTIVVVKYDTLRFDIPVPVDSVVTDTFYVMVNADYVKKDTQNNADYVKKDTQNNAYYVKLEREQVHYSKDGVYDAWVSGFRPRLDSFTIYGKETTTSITKNIITHPNWNYYATVTTRQYGNKYFLGVGAQAVGKKFLLGGEIGVLDNKLYYGINLGIKLQ
jgi:hypothetical protein